MEEAVLRSDRCSIWGQKFRIAALGKKVRGICILSLHEDFNGPLGIVRVEDSVEDVGETVMLA